MADNFIFIWDDELSEWLENIDEDSLDISNAEEQLDGKEISSFIEENRNNNTTKKTKTDLNVWTRWCDSINDRRSMEDIPPDKLNSLLSHFFIKIRKLNGKEFEPGTLISFQRSLDNYLRQHGNNYSIMQDNIFEKSHETLESKRKQLKLSVKGGRPNKALGLTDDELEKFWSAKQLGDNSPEALLRTVWLNSTMHFGWRVRDEHHKVLLEDLEIRREEGGEMREYIIWKMERGSKRRTGGKEFGSHRYFSPRIYATGGDRFPVNIFKIFLARRPPDMIKPDSPLYLAVIKSPKTEVWYKRQPLGIHSLGQFMRMMADSVNLTGKHTNHSARRTMITALRHKNANPLDISQLVGHKNLKSIDSYSTVSVEQQKEISLKISSHCGARPALNQLSLNSHLQSSMATGTNASTACGNQLFYGAVFNNCTIFIGGKSPQIPSKRRRIVLHKENDE
ncbi:uncharacterized protein KIAA1958-like [Stylophora pistillata]|uniref:uncharacterized protein KIAA1958-like n=1 Tax=Stylophora pistillata TaxID=50429 RepID=UPI000C03B742|nr:uncharacterized protein KIAA1958-like [Stylophora pistillata]